MRKYNETSLEAIGTVEQNMATGEDSSGEPLPAAATTLIPCSLLGTPDPSALSYVIVLTALSAGKPYRTALADLKDLFARSEFPVSIVDKLRLLMIYVVTQDGARPRQGVLHGTGRLPALASRCEAGRAPATQCSGWHRARGSGHHSKFVLPRCHAFAGNRFLAEKTNSQGQILAALPFCVFI